MTDTERMSYKFKVKCSESNPMLDYVFAATAADAHTKAYILLDIPTGEPIEVIRVSEPSGLIWRLN